MEQTSGEKLLTPLQAAEALGCKPATILRLAAQRKLARVLPTRSPRFTRFRAQDVDSYIQRCRQAADAEMALTTAEAASMRRLHDTTPKVPPPPPNGSPIRGTGTTN